MLVSVVICTRDRAASLERTLHSVRRAAGRAHGDWELIVVDNASGDHTPAIIAAHAPALPIRRVGQPLAGLSNARNAGVAAARGRFILWTDDDVVVHEDWLASWFAAFRRHPELAVFGGRTQPVYEEPVQDWFVANEAALASLLAIRDEPSWEAITTEQLPFGLNYAVRAEEQRAHPYDPRLGVAPGRRQGGEETAVVRAILDAGGTGRWVWEALVYHLIPAERQTLDYVRRYYLAHGFQYPDYGARSGLASRIWAAARIVPKLAGSAMRNAALKDRDRAASVPHLIARTCAEASLRRHLGLRAP